MSKKKIKNLQVRQKKQEKRFTFRNKAEWVSFCDWVAKQKQRQKNKEEKKKQDV